MPISLCFEESGVTVTEIYFCSVCASAERWRVAMYKLLCFWCPLVVYLGGVCGRCDARFCTHTSGRRTTTDCGSLSDRRRSFAEAEWRHARATKRLTSVFKRERERERDEERDGVRGATLSKYNRFIGCVRSLRVYVRKAMCPSPYTPSQLVCYYVARVFVALMDRPD